MTYIANPIYDSVFKYLMEDEKVAKVLLRALLKKDITELSFHKQEYTSVQQNRISLFRMDFTAKIRDTDGSEHLVLIELQKTWLATETLRFRQYLGTQYLNKENMSQDTEGAFGIPIISIYILGHLLGDLKEPVIYVRRRYLDYYDQVIDQTDKFIESLTHDSIIVQIPCLQGHARNHLERLLLLFDQDLRVEGDDHTLEIDEDDFTAEEQPVIYRLLKAGATKELRRQMDVEDEILSEIEARDTVIMQKEAVIERKNLVIEQKEQMIEQKEQVIEQKEQVIEQKEQVIEQKEQVIEQKEQMIEQKEQLIEQKDLVIEQMIEQNKSVIKTMINLLHQSGHTPEKIASQLGISIEQVLSIIG